MAAPTTAPTAGAGTITTTGEDNGFLITVRAGISRPRLLLGVSGTFTTCVLAVRGRLRGLTNYYPVRGVRRADSAPVDASGAIALTDSTNAAYAFDVSGCDYVEVYCVSGTPTSLAVEERVEAADPSSVPLVVANTGTAQAITSASATAFTVGANGATNPVLQVNANTASVATGLKVTGAAAAAGLAVAVISSGTDESLTVNAKGAGTVTIGATSTGAVTIGATSQALIVPGPLTRGIGASTAAAGSATGDAGALPAGTAGVYPTTGADDTKGVVISTSDKVTGRQLFIGNGVSNKILKVYPPSGGTINGAAGDAAFSSASGKGVIAVCLSSGSNTWLAL